MLLTRHPVALRSTSGLLSGTMSQLTAEEDQTCQDPLLRAWNTPGEPLLGNNLTAFLGVSLTTVCNAE